MAEGQCPHKEHLNMLFRLLEEDRGKDRQN